ncbi:hypothetical protein ZIOFF_056068 [Zingiber officinale]|uniref:Uncharacterized protein n=1 Tax=Zingiber officinale TaxID=94328 RepID=A0A8J5FGM9_ZINOF|nr:hypothetical protein ZIOFF_056068 [Zingiber officinale]
MSTAIFFFHQQGGRRRGCRERRLLKRCFPSLQLFLSSLHQSSSITDMGATNEEADEEDAASADFSRGIGMMKFTAAARESIDAVSTIHKRSKSSSHSKDRQTIYVGESDELESGEEEKAMDSLMATTSALFRSASKRESIP